MIRFAFPLALVLAQPAFAQESAFSATPDAGVMVAEAPPAPDAGVDDGDTFTARAPTNPAPPPAAGAPVDPNVRQTMDAFANNSTSELHIGSMRARYSLNVFGDINAHVDNVKTDHPSFFLGNVDLLLGFRLEKGFSGVAELKFGVNDQAVGTIDMERFDLRWDGDYFFVELGREHTEIGFWNNAWHHGVWLQPTYARPRWIGFKETGLVPVHRIGLLGGVKIPAGPGQFKISLSVDNSRGVTRTDVRNTSDLIDPKMLFASLEYIGLGLRELRLGVSGIADKIPAASATVRPSFPEVQIGESIGSFYIAYTGARLLLDAETFFIHQAANEREWQNYGGFFVASLSFGPLSPYAMIERIWRTGGPSPFFVPDPKAAGALSTDNFTVNAGLRYDLSDWNSLKLEYRYTRFYDQASTVHEVTLSWNFGL